MIDKLKQNKVFGIVTPLVSLLVLFACERFVYQPYVTGVIWQIALCYAAMAVSLCALAFWFALSAFDKTPSPKSLTVFTVAAGLILVGLYIGASAALRSNTNAVYAYGVSTGVLDALILMAFGYALAKSSKKTAIALTATALVFVIAFLSSFYTRPASGPVTTDFSVADTLPDGGNKPVKVILLAGQSNASGVSYVSYLSRKAEPARYRALEAGYPNILINYFNDNGNNTSNGRFVPVGLNQGCAVGFFGPELGLAETLSAAYPDETIIIIKYAWGGTNLYDQWLSPSSEGDTGLLYAAFTNFVRSSMYYLRSKNYNAQIVAMCWMQGESDSDDINCKTYGTHTANFVSDLRAEFSPYISDSGMLFVDAGISDSIYWKNYTVINEAKAAHAGNSPLNVYVDTIEAGLSITAEPEGNPDLAHYDALSELLLGNLFAEAIVSRLGN
jgi:hypothetical protein